MFFHEGWIEISSSGWCGDGNQALYSNVMVLQDVPGLPAGVGLDVVHERQAVGEVAAPSPSNRDFFDGFL